MSDFQDTGYASSNTGVNSDVVLDMYWISTEYMLT